MSAAERDLVLGDAAEPALRSPALRLVGTAFALVNRVVVVVAAVAVVAAGVVLTHEAVVRYAFHHPADWQDEMAVFLLVGATFMSAAWVQARRGHVAIDAVAELLPPGVERWRRFVADLASFGFCAFFSWKSWALWHEAWVDGMVTQSAWAPPLWIPYSVMALGMSLLTVQILLQMLDFLLDGEAA
ncbi:TRAP transporter small permease [Azospirillum picis]|uniref:TRAP transporter small permease protein n=1 Tax=Azospirillum picis TaxID=488438 RepID=A0ABU0MJC5_9PROT|nr:TRAP transporter small permease [Azospirillum picis]MBP2299752.1 TRAP-type C4-dicarboxylate transport system permease small subunit [Azospirillum picis]MDQ0533548.1 TRAP-type C4-dicarboxylate transport system permease small subunit [Azospirillum picis]